MRKAIVIGVVVAASVAMVSMLARPLRVWEDWGSTLEPEPMPAHE